MDAGEEAGLEDEEATATRRGPSPGRLLLPEPLEEAKGRGRKSRVGRPRRLPGGRGPLREGEEEVKDQAEGPQEQEEEQEQEQEREAQEEEEGEEGEV